MFSESDDMRYQSCLKVDPSDMEATGICILYNLCYLFTDRKFDELLKFSLKGSDYQYEFKLIKENVKELIFFTDIGIGNINNNFTCILMQRGV